MRRVRIGIAVGFAVFLFLGFAFLLARGLTGAGSERAAVRDVLEAQARGDAEAVLADLPACRAEPACAQVTAERTRELQRPGRVEILTYSPSVQVALTERTGVGRVAWRAGTELPVVQCVRVRREGPLTGADVELLALSAPIGREAGC
jgi:uncharacterized protein (DUF58 family)